MRPVIEGRTARAGTNRLDPESIRRVVEEAIAITRLTAPDPTLPELAGPAEYARLERHFEATAQATPRERALAVAEAIAVVEGAGQTAAGIYSTGESVFALLNSRGVFARHAETMARFSITAMAPGSSGWAKASHCDHRALGPARPGAGRRPEGRPIGQPARVAARPLHGDSGTGRGARPGGPDVRRFQRHRRARWPQLPEQPHRQQAVRRKHHHSGRCRAPRCNPARRSMAKACRGSPLTLVERGVVREIAYSRQAAALAGAEPTGHGYPLPNDAGEAPANIVILGGATPVDRMVAACPRGILVTRLWYIREVDPYEKIFTGMTRDGTFLVEDGQVTAGLRNFRFNESLIEMLSHVEAMSEPVRASGEEAFDLVAPAMQVGGFRLTEVTRF